MMNFEGEEKDQELVLSDYQSGQKLLDMQIPTYLIASKETSLKKSLRKGSAISCKTIHTFAN